MVLLGSSSNRSALAKAMMPRSWGTDRARSSQRPMPVRTCSPSQASPRHSGRWSWKRLRVAWWVLDPVKEPRMLTLSLSLGWMLKEHETSSLSLGRACSCHFRPRSLAQTSNKRGRPCVAHMNPTSSPRRPIDIRRSSPTQSPSTNNGDKWVPERAPRASKASHGGMPWR